MIRKLSISKERLNDYELQRNRVSYSNLINYYCDNMVLCNNISESDTFREELYDAIYNCWDIMDEDERIEHDDDYDNYLSSFDIFQYYITDMNDYEVERLRELNNELIVYSSDLDCYVLCVTHYGTSWNYVLTNVEPNTEEETW